MSPDEIAEMNYSPDEGDHDRVHRALSRAERELASRPDVLGVGLGRTPAGDDAVVVYVRNRDAMRALPNAIDDVAVVGELTGDIDAL